jgi:CDP-4-dehydro-6-deoxyglucose reductase
MIRVDCDGGALSVDAGETLLEALLRGGVPVPNSCRAGACQSCLVRAVSGAPPVGSQVGLKPTLAAQGYFLACQAVPTENLTVTVAGVDRPGVRATVAAVERLSLDVVRVRLEPEKAFEYRAGQFVHLVRPADGLLRSYSLASLPERDQLLELHVRALPNGRMSHWLSDGAALGATVEIRGPSGDCFYVPGVPQQPLLLAGTGTGLAPLLGVARDALASGHRGPITLIHGARSRAGLYLIEEIRALARRHPELSYVPCVLDGPDAEGIEVAPLDRVLFTRVPSLRGHRVFLCGDPELVAVLRKKVFLAGARLADIQSDAFVTTPPPRDTRGAAGTTTSGCLL